jgi:hypothetical protein
MREFIVMCSVVFCVAYWSHLCDLHDAHWVSRYAGCALFGIIAASFLIME